MKGDATLTELARRFELHPRPIGQWRDDCSPGPSTSSRRPASRKVLRSRVSTTMDSRYCLEAVKEAIGRYRCPALFNTDQGRLFTSADYKGLLTAHGIRVCMDGQGSWRDDTFVERFWRTIKYKEVDQHADATVSDARAALGRYLTLSNTRRRQSTRADTPPTRRASLPCGRHFGWPRSRPPSYIAHAVSLSDTTKPLLQSDRTGTQQPNDVLSRGRPTWAAVGFNGG